MNTASKTLAPTLTDHGTDGCSIDGHGTDNHSTDHHGSDHHGSDHHGSDIRPLITRHRSRRRRRRTAATLLAGASIALGAAAMRSPGASAHAPAGAPVTDASSRPAASHQPPPAPITPSSEPAIVPTVSTAPTAEAPIVSSAEPEPDASSLEAPSTGDQADDDVRISG